MVISSPLRAKARTAFRVVMENSAGKDKNTTNGKGKGKDKNTAKGIGKGKDKDTSKGKGKDKDTVTQLK